MVFKLNPSWSGCRKANYFSWWWMLAHLQLCQWKSLCKHDMHLERRPLEKIFIYLLIWLGISCGMWDLIPQAGIRPRLPAIGSSESLPTGPPRMSLERTLEPDWLDSDPGSVSGSVWFLNFGQITSLPAPQFPYLHNEDDSFFLRGWLWGLNVPMHVTSTKQVLDKW